MRRQILVWMQKLIFFLLWGIDCRWLCESGSVDNKCFSCGEKNSTGQFAQTKQGLQPLIICECGYIMIPWGFEKEQILALAKRKKP